MELSTHMRNILGDACGDEHNGGTLVFKTAGDNEVATLTFGNPAFGAASGGTITANSLTSDPSATGGTIDHAELYDDAGTPNLLETMSVTLTGGGGDIIVTSLDIAATEKVNVTSVAITVPAS